MDNTLDTAGAVASYLNDAQSPAQLGAQARLSMMNTVGGQPDYEAELQRVAQRTGVPVDTVRAYPDEMKNQATLASYDFDKIAAEFPGTAKFLANQDRAAIAHDDVPALSSLEQAAKMFVSGAKYLASAPGASSTLGGDIAAAYHGAQSGTAGAFGGIARTVGAPLGFMENFPSVGGNPLERLSEGFMGIANTEAAASKAAAGKSETWLGGAISSGVQSLAQNAPLMLSAFLPGGQGAALTGMASMAGGQSYQKDMADGVPHWKSALHGISDGVIEAGTEMGPLHGLIHEMKAGTPLFNSILKNAWQENKGEQVATVLQDLNEWAVNGSNQGKTFGDYLAERPEAAMQTAIATLIGAGGNVTLMHNIQSAMDAASGTQRQAQQAEQSAQMLDALQTTLQASRLLERSPETLRAYMQGLADEGVPQVFVNSAALVEAGVDIQALAQAVPSVASQLAQVQTGGDLVIPTGELLTNTIGTEFAQSLIEHARTDEGAMSRAEARVFMQDGGGAQLNAEISRVLAERDSDAEFKAGRDALQAQLLTQLNEVKRFTPKVNEQYATLAASFYAVMAARTGMTVGQFADTYRLGFSGNGKIDKLINSSISGELSPDGAPVAPHFPDENRKAKPETSIQDPAAIIDAQDAAAQAEAVPTPAPDTQESQPTYVKGDVVELPVASLALSGDVPQFKSDAGANGVTQGAELKGKYDRALASPIQVWQRLDGRLEVVSGRHRFDLAQRSGETTIPAQIHREADGFDADKARMLDIELNVKDGRGKVKDYVAYFKELHPSREQASADGLLNTAVGRQAYTIADAGSETLIAAHANNAITDEAAVSIAQNAPGNEALQNLGIQQVASGKPINHAVNMMRAARAAGFEGGTSGDMFGFDDSFAKEAEAIAKEASKQQHALRQQLAAIRGASKRPELAAKGGVSVKNLKATQKTIVELEAKLTALDGFATNPEVYRQLRVDAGLAPKGEAAPETLTSPTEQDILDQQDRAENADQLDAQAQIDREASAQTLTMQDAPEQRRDGSGDMFAMEKAQAEIDQRNAGRAANEDPNQGNSFNQGTSARAQISFGDDITLTRSIIFLLSGADLSSFLHEGGHFFLEVQADLAARIAARIAQGEQVSEGEQSILADMNKTLAWLGVKDTPEASALQEWITMPLEQKRGLHERWARGFEAYAFEGKAPSMELTKMFQTFRAWLVNVYRALTKAEITQTLQVELTDEVRGVMDRMLATSNQIAEAEAARGMGPLFQTAEQAGMTMDEFKAYHDAGMQATMDAVGELESRSLKDLQWAQNAKSRILKALQKEHDAERRETAMRVRAEVMSEPVYQAWTYLTAKAQRANEPSQVELDYVKAKAEHQQRRTDAEELARTAGREALFAANPGVKGLQRGQLLAKNKKQMGLDVQQVMLNWDKANPAPQKPAPALAEITDPLFEIGKLDAKALKEAYGIKANAPWRTLQKLGMTREESGQSPDVVAERFGLSSGDELVQRLATAENPKDLIERLTDQRMLENYGDLATPEGLERAAEVAIHNAARARFVATELKALQNAMNVRAKVPGKKHTVDVLAQAAREYAESIIAQLRVRDIRPGQYAAAEVRAARAAAKESGNLAKQAEHKRNQLINMEAARAAYAAQDEVKALQKYFRKFDKRIKSIDSEYQDQIEQLLEKFDFRPASLKTIDRYKSLAVWYAEQEAAGNVPDIPQALLDKAVLTSFKDATVEELRGLRDTIKQIEHQGRLKNKLLLARDQREFGATAEEMAAGIVAHGGKVRPIELEGPNKAVDLAEGFTAQHRKLASLFRQMDGNNDHGPLYERIGRAMNERGTMEDVMIEKATQALSDIYAPMLALRGGITGYKSKVFIPEISASLTRGGRLSIALNWGNEDNRQRVMAGDKWSAAQVAAILKTLTPAELQFVNQIHEYLDTFWPEIAAKEKRLTGIEPKKVEATPYVAVAADGTQVAMRGGYYPLKYDPGRSDKTDQQEAVQAAKEMMQGLTTRATTRRGHTKERAKEVERAVRKDLNVITQHVVQVTHDLAWHEWLIDTNRLLSDQRVVGAIRDHYGKQVIATLRDGVMGIAGGNTVAQTSLETVMLHLRSNVSRATMGLSLTTGFLQPFGLTQSMYRIGVKSVLRGAARWAGDAARMESTVGWINSKSDFMRLRNTTFNKELREIHGSVAGKSRAMQIADAGLFMMMRKMQMIADVPTWCGQYEKSMAQGLDEASAVAMADRAVLESQGGGHNKDLSEIQRKHPFLTQFYSYFSVTMNLTAEATAATDFKNPRAVVGWMGDMALLNIIPALLPSLLMYALKGGGGDDDVASWIKRLAKWQLGYLMGMVVGLREFSGIVSGFDYTGPPAGRIVVDSYKFADQAWQGEIDEPAVLALASLMGSGLGIPSVQLLRSYRGWKAWDEGKDGTGPQSVLFGPPLRD